MNDNEMKVCLLSRNFFLKSVSQSPDFTPPPRTLSIQTPDTRFHPYTGIRVLRTPPDHYFAHIPWHPDGFPSVVTRPLQGAEMFPLKGDASYD